MSMNLHLEAHKGAKFNLWQTPTFITDMCMSYNLKKRRPDGGMKGVLRRYIFWVVSHRNGSRTADEQRLVEENIREHLHHLKHFIKTHKGTFEFYAL